MDKRREMSESGMLVYPKLPVPKAGRESRPKLGGGGGGGGGGKRTLLFLAVALIAGALGGLFAGPQLWPDPRIGSAERTLATATTELRAQQAAAAKLAREVEGLTSARAALEVRLAELEQELAGSAAEREARAKTASAAAKKLDGALPKAAQVRVDGADVRVTMSDRALFKGNGDELTPAGTRLLDKLAGVLKELGDRQIAVHGHTDDQPPPRPAAPKPAPPAKPAKGKAAKKAPAPVPPPAPAFATNWELSAARALAVVHYLQDTHKLDPKRLGAQAFSQYRPVSKDRAANRRVEIVLSPRPAKP